MKFTGQFQKKPAASSAPIPYSTGMFRSRPFPTPEAQRSPAATPDHEPMPRRNPDYNRIFGVQPKLTVGAPNDVYEQEADRVADQVMSMPDKPIQRMDNLEEEEIQTKPLAGSITPLVQRIDNLEEEEIQTKAIGSIQREDVLEEEDLQMKPTLQRSPDGSLQAGGSIESQLNSSKGGGSPLPDEVRSFMEPRFGADFSQVRVHTGNEAIQMNQDLNAQAFTHKQDVYFSVGKAPAKDALTAHELTHVIQQTGEGNTKIAVSSSSTEKDIFLSQETQAQDFGFDNINVSLAVDREPDSIGHAWIIIDEPNKPQDSYGFWPTSSSVLGGFFGGWWGGKVVHPDTSHTPNALFTARTDQAGLQRGINYAKSKSDTSYHLLLFNCSTFARSMFKQMTGQDAPSGGLIVDSPNELAEKIAEKNKERGE